MLSDALHPRSACPPQSTTALSNPHPDYSPSDRICRQRQIIVPRRPLIRCTPPASFRPAGLGTDAATPDMATLVLHRGHRQVGDPGAAGRALLVELALLRGPADPSRAHEGPLSYGVSELGSAAGVIEASQEA